MSLKQANWGLVRIEIIDALGRVLHQEQTNIQSNNFEKTYHLDLLPSQYYIRIGQGKRFIVETIQIE